MLCVFIFVLCLKVVLGFSFSDDNEQFRNEKEDMMRSENNSQWSEDDSPPILVVPKNQNIGNIQNQNMDKFEPLLKPLAYKQNQLQTKA